MLCHTVLSQGRSLTLLITLIQRYTSKKFIKYLFVGGTVFVIHTIMLWFFKRILYLENFVSSTIAYAIGVVSHFLLNNFFTFSDSSTNYKRRIFGYIIVVACNFIINSIIVNSILSFVIDNVLLATIASTSVTVLFSFFVLNKLVYLDSEKENN
jgi:putative flippase GtrA